MESFVHRFFDDGVSDDPVAVADARYRYRLRSKRSLGLRQVRIWSRSGPTRTRSPRRVSGKLTGPQTSQKAVVLYSALAPWIGLVSQTSSRLHSGHRSAGGRSSRECPSLTSAQV